MSLFCSPSMCKNRTVKLKQLHQNLLFFVLLGFFCLFLLDTFAFLTATAIKQPQHSFQLRTLYLSQIN